MALRIVSVEIVESEPTPDQMIAWNQYWKQRIAKAKEEVRNQKIASSINKKSPDSIGTQ